MSSVASIRSDEQRTHSLLQFIVDEGMVPSSEDKLKRVNAIEKLKQIVLAWIKKVAWQRRLPKNQIASSRATILTYGSYDLGVHGPESDIDALCVGPFYATMVDDFFIVLRNMLQSAPEVSEIQCVKDARVPIMSFKLNGISFDLPYASLPGVSPFEYEDILNPLFMEKIDETSWRSLSGVRTNMHIRQLVPNLENFQSMLRSLKLWASRRGVYSHSFGYFGGIHLAILAAHICRIHPEASVNALVSWFFATYSCWPWPTPVTLQDESVPMIEVPRGYFHMPIVIPCGPLYENCFSNITRSTYEKIKNELSRAHNITQDLGRPDFEWCRLFDPFAYTKNYSNFVRIFLTAADDDELRDWMGWVKSRFCSLILKLEGVHGFCDPNPTEYVDHEIVEPHTVFYWGLLHINSSVDIFSIQEEFMEILGNCYQGSGCMLELSIVNLYQLPTTVLFAGGSEKGSKACWRIFDYCEWRKPVYSQHLPEYFVGYVATDRDTYLSAEV